ncbi:MAG: ammonium transporter [Planctomycetota bacterium]|jgi:Amt family ammonium transporter|nr:ammonium transporter [Planctomycetota bacterium]
METTALVAAVTEGTAKFSAPDTIWVLLGAALVFFMQAGFTMVEIGFTRNKNTGNMVMKNVMDFCIASMAFWVVGFGLMFGEGTGFIGSVDLFVSQNYDGVFGNFPGLTFLIFQTVFCGTATTIISGGMAERTKFSAYCIYSLMMSLLIYPISGHWIWGGGWLAELGFHDFAGSTAVHMVGGVAALVGAWILGPRIGKYDSHGKANAIPGQSLALGSLGVFILWFAWFGFNGCSTVSASGDDTILSMSSIFVTTNLAAASAALFTMLISWLRYGKPDVSMTLNGALGGLVGITAGCDAVTPGGAVLIGIVSAVVLTYSIEFVDQKLKIDDPVGAFGVHGICGAVGTILVGLLAVDGGVFYGGGWTLFGIQTLGVVSVALWVVVTMGIIYSLVNATIGLRVSPAEEIAGLDIEEHGIVDSYPGYMSGRYTSVKTGNVPVVKTGATAPAPAAKASAAKPADGKGHKITRVDIITRPEKFAILKEAMHSIGIQGMTVTKVMGCGVQQGNSDYYRGVEVASNMLPKLSISIVVSKVPVRDVIETAKKILYTGHIGDGKIFLSDVENAVKVRTGEEGFDALQYSE